MKKQTFNDGICNIYKFINGGAQELIYNNIRFNNRILGYKRLLEAANAHINISKIIRISKLDSIDQYCIVEIEKTEYEVAMVQNSYDIYPNCLDLTLQIYQRSTAIRILEPTVNKVAGYNKSSWTDMLDQDVYCEWNNISGNESLNNNSQVAVENAKIRMGYLPGITKQHRIKRVEDNAEFEITSIIDVLNINQKLEIELKRQVKGG